MESLGESFVEIVGNGDDGDTVDGSEIRPAPLYETFSIMGYVPYQLVS